MYFVEEKLISCVLSWADPPVLVDEITWLFAGNVASSAVSTVQMLL